MKNCAPAFAGAFYFQLHHEPRMPSPCNDQPSPAAQPKLPRDIKRGARDNLIDFARAIDVPGRPVSEDQDEPRFATIETALARHHKLLSRGAD